MIALSQHPEAVGKVFNIGGDEEISILDLAEKVKRVASSGAPVEFISYQEAYQSGFEDMPRRVPDLGRIRRLIGYQPTKTLDAMLQAIADSVEKKAFAAHAGLRSAGSGSVAADSTD